MYFIKVRYWDGEGWGAWHFMKTLSSPKKFSNKKCQVKILHSNKDK